MTRDADEASDDLRAAADKNTDPPSSAAAAALAVLPLRVRDDEATLLAARLAALLIPIAGDGLRPLTDMDVPLPRGAVLATRLSLGPDLMRARTASA